MPLEVIGAGLGRTGTISIQQALNILYEQEGKQCYHFGSIMTRPDHASIWIRLLSNRCNKAKQQKNKKAIERHAQQNITNEDETTSLLMKSVKEEDNKEEDNKEEEVTINWEDEIFGPEKFVATLDSPCANFYQELMAIYPNAKVILTRHPGGREKWYESKLSHELLNNLYERYPLKLFARIANWFFYRKLMPAIATRPIPFEQMLTLMQLTKLNTCGEKGVRDKENMLGRYDEWYANVLKIVPKEKLLEYDVSMGWEPLCNFVGKPIPNDTVLFPKETNHSSKEIKQFVARAETYAWIVLGIVGSGIIYAFTILLLKMT